VALLNEQGVSFLVHAHEPTRTIEDAQRNLFFDIERIVKTVAFQLRDGRLVLAALRGTRRVDYARLAGVLGVNRRDLRSLSPEEVVERLGVAPGGVSPLTRPEGASALLDMDALSIRPTLYCGAGRLDRTLELAPEDLLRLADCRKGEFSR
jgi:Cys-tRNA(Pro)/Cys-tRNA(Cys) deacylase